MEKKWNYQGHKFKKKNAGCCCRSTGMISTPTQQEAASNGRAEPTNPN